MKEIDDPRLRECLTAFAARDYLACHLAAIGDSALGPTARTSGLPSADRHLLAAPRSGRGARRVAAADARRGHGSVGEIPLRPEPH
jgi:hypothetical protein